MQSVNNILKGFSKLVVKLEAHAVEQGKSVDKKVEQKQKLQVEIGECQSEIVKATSIAAKIKDLIGWEDVEND